MVYPFISVKLSIGDLHMCTCARLRACDQFSQNIHKMGSEEAKRNLFSRYRFIIRRTNVNVKVIM